MATCSPKLEEFKFCMSLKGMHPEEKRDVWIRRRAEWWARRRAHKSSEDVWDVRTLVSSVFCVPHCKGELMMCCVAS